MQMIEGGTGGGGWWDKVPSKFARWGEREFLQPGFRAVPSAIVRHSAYIAPSVVLMPCFVNVGARVESGTMIDTWSTVGSCAQIGKNCHISAGVGIAGVLEPLHSDPVIIEDDCFIGARSEIAEGVIVKQVERAPDRRRSSTICCEIENPHELMPLYVPLESRARRTVQQLVSPGKK